jgi:hypothetical protein
LLPTWFSRANRALATGILVLIVGAAWAKIGEQNTMFWAGGRHQTYRAISEWLRQHARSTSDSVLSKEVGTIGYLTSLKMIDYAGLVSPIWTGQQRMDLTSVVDQFGPTFILADDRWLATVQKTAQQYVVVAHMPPKNFREFFILQRRLTLP